MENLPRPKKITRYLPVLEPVRNCRFALSTRCVIYDTLMIIHSPRYHPERIHSTGPLRQSLPAPSWVSTAGQPHTPKYRYAASYVPSIQVKWFIVGNVKDTTTYKNKKSFRPRFLNLNTTAFSNWATLCCGALSCALWDDWSYSRTLLASC